MTKEQIHTICEQYGVNNYTINDDMSIDVDGDINFFDRQLEKLPLKFGKVSGNFYCGFNKLTSLEGSPAEVGGYFICSNNKLTSLIGSSIKVCGSFYCHNNQLTSFEGGPKFVGGEFYCDGGNPISEEFKTKFDKDYNLYLKYTKRQKILKGILND